MFQVSPEVLDYARALGEGTRFAIYRHIAASATPLTVKDLVDHLDMHHSAIRIHLSKLEDAGLIVSQKKHRPGAVGRPQLSFAPSPQVTSIVLPPRSYDFLARVALAFVAKSDGETDLREFGLAWGEGHVRDRGLRVNGPLPLAEALEVLRAEMPNSGASVAVGAADGGYEISFANCVFAELAPEFDPLVCTLHQGVLEGILTGLSETPFTWRQTERLCAGAARCSVLVEPARD